MNSTVATKYICEELSESKNVYHREQSEYAISDNSYDESKPKTQFWAKFGSK